MRVKQGFGVALLLAAILLIADGVYIKGKAMVAQYLLQQAWQEAIKKGEPVKPWQWADTWPIARLRVERLGVDSIVLEGESGEVLAFGPGHISRSSYPAENGNCTLVGHRDTTFKFLKHLKKGDLVELESVKQRKRTYQVMSIFVMDRADLFFDETPTPWLTLITCYPFDGLQSGGSLRYVVFAKDLGFPAVST